MNTEKIAAEALLERGVKVELPAPWLLRCLGKKKLAVHVKRPNIITLLEVCRVYLGMQIDVEKLSGLTMDEGFKLYAQHEADIRRIAAIVICPSTGSGAWIMPGAARWCMSRLLRSADPQEVYTIFYLVVIFGGLKSFLNTIRLISTTRITEPRNLSHSQGS